MCRAGARSSLSYRSSLRRTHVSVKVQLPHERYDEMASRLPGLIERAMQQAARGDGGAPVLHQRQATAGSGAAQASAGPSAPRLLTYTHFQGCLAGVLQYDSEHALPPASRVSAELQRLLPGDMQLVHVCMQEASSIGSRISASNDSSSSDAAEDGCGWPWLDPVAIAAESAACSLDVVLHPRVLRQLQSRHEQELLQQLRVVLAEAGGEVLSDGIVELDVQGDLAGGGGAVKVRTPPTTAPAAQHCCLQWR